MTTNRAIDCLVNVHFGETEQQPGWMLKVRDDYFKGPESMFAPVDLSELLDESGHTGADHSPARAPRLLARAERHAVAVTAQAHLATVVLVELGVVLARGGRVAVDARGRSPHAGRPR